MSVIKLFVWIVEDIQDKAVMFTHAPNKMVFVRFTVFAYRTLTKCYSINVGRMG